MTDKVVLGSTVVLVGRHFTASHAVALVRVCCVPLAQLWLLICCTVVGRPSSLMQNTLKDDLGVKSELTARRGA